MRNKKRQNPAMQGASGRDMTFRELVAWLVRRHRLRRRYSFYQYREQRKKQIFSAVVFLAVVLLLLPACMTAVRMQSQPMTGAFRAALYADGASANPALGGGEVTCTVNVKIGTGAVFAWETPAVTVADMLADVGYTPTTDDIISVSPDTVVEEGMTVTVVCVTYEETEEVVSVPYGTVYEDVQTIPKGATERISYGTDGVAKQVLRNRYENGEYISTEVLSSEIVTAPVDEVLRRGVGGIVYGAEGAFAYSYYIEVTATAYGGYEETRYTYTGTVAREGVIAVDPDVIALGTKVYVKGNYGDYGVCYADDIGSGIKGYRIDIFMDATEEVMREFGIRNMRVYILE
ncbi:MAG: G5 domain-containing protein [Clostridia bacterium]|nr:G5 domain-containing protein [Clostridia bacterium]